MAEHPSVETLDELVELIQRVEAVYAGRNALTSADGAALEVRVAGVGLAAGALSRADGGAHGAVKVGAMVCARR